MNALSQLVLASRSAVRVKLLRDAGITFTADAADLDEDALVKDISDAEQQARALAREKALHVAARWPGAFVLGGDQTGCTSDGFNLVKPRDGAHHVDILMALANKTHTFFPAVALVKDGEVLAEVSDRVSVTFRDFDENTARAYAATGEGQGSCGGYESEHRGAQLIARVEGSLQAVLGFPLLLVLPLLRAHCPREAGLL